MKKSRFTESQIVAILKEGEAGVAVAQLTRKSTALRAFVLASLPGVTRIVLRIRKRSAACETHIPAPGHSPCP